MTDDQADPNDDRARARMRRLPAIQAMTSGRPAGDEPQEENNDDIRPAR
jgi:hypothetical protein